MLCVDAVVHTETDRIVTPDEAAELLGRLMGTTHVLLLINPDACLLLTNDRWAWSYHAAEVEAKRHGYARFVTIDRDGKRSEGAMTGRDVFVPVVRRQLAVVA